MDKASKAILGEEKMIRRFIFEDCLIENSTFEEEVKKGWEVQVKGVKMFQVWRKLSSVRERLRSLTKPMLQASEMVRESKVRLDRVQALLQKDPTNISLLEQMNVE